MTFKAYENIGTSVVRVYPEIYDAYIQNKEVLYIGLKDTSSLRNYLTKLPYIYQIHTIDKMAQRGRGVDETLINPITFNKMTGSSSGTAINVLLGINDIGIGTDGGGSVLSPAISLNLYGFISPLLPINSEQKKSTDGILFKASAGFISKDLNKIKFLTNSILSIEQEVTKEYKVLSYTKNYITPFNESMPNINQREEMINILTNKLKQFDYIVYEEDIIDYYEYDESVHGVLCNRENQDKGNKKFVKVINMVGATAITVPQNKVSSSYVVICKSNEQYLPNLFNIANELSVKLPSMISDYFKPNINKKI